MAEERTSAAVQQAIYACDTCGEQSTFSRKAGQALVHRCQNGHDQTLPMRYPHFILETSDGQVTRFGNIG